MITSREFWRTKKDISEEDLKKFYNYIGVKYKIGLDSDEKEICWWVSHLHRDNIKTEERIEFDDSKHWTSDIFYDFSIAKEVYDEMVSSGLFSKI